MRTRETTIAITQPDQPPSGGRPAKLDISRLICHYMPHHLALALLANEHEVELCRQPTLLKADLGPLIHACRSTHLLGVEYGGGCITAHFGLSRRDHPTLGRLVTLTAEIK